MNNGIENRSQAGNAAWGTPTLEGHGPLQDLTRLIQGSNPDDFAFGSGFNDSPR